MQREEKWTEIYARLAKADRQGVLEPHELETCALAAYLTGRDAEGFELFERAHHAYLQQENPERAGRCAFWLGLILMNAGERARGGGWFSRGERILDTYLESDCAERGLFFVPAGLGALSRGDPAEARHLFSQAVSIGVQHDDVDVIALARLGHGQALILQGEVNKGVQLLDETMVTVQTETVYPIVAGIVYCAVIETCRRVWDLRRAQEWTAALTRWCEAHPDIVPFRGQCAIRRAEIMQFYGEWHRALEETGEACELLSQPPGEPAAGEAFYRKGEVLRLLGNFEEAEKCYHEAGKWGRKPQPGLALLRLAQGNEGASETSIQNILRETRDSLKRAELLPAAVHIMIATQCVEDAREAANELSEIAGHIGSTYLSAMSSHCEGAVFLQEGNAHLALGQLRTALDLWNTLDLPYESARTRELQGLVYRALNDVDNADAELAAARWIYQQLEATPDLDRINRLLTKKLHHETHGLTLRELQVLRHVASGKTNKSVAGELFISERTVDRHVSNIFNKLGVSSRVGATAYALKKKILDN